MIMKTLGFGSVAASALFTVLAVVDATAGAWGAALVNGGFAVLCGLLLWYIAKIANPRHDDLVNRMLQREDKHKTDIDELRELDRVRRKEDISQVIDTVNNRCAICPANTECHDDDSETP